MAEVQGRLVNKTKTAALSGGGDKRVKGFEPTSIARVRIRRPLCCGAEGGATPLCNSPQEMGAPLMGGRPRGCG